MMVKTQPWMPVRCFNDEQLLAMQETPKPDMVNNPPHYTKHPSGVECIEITRHMSFNIGNAFKYVWRADEKGSDIQDLQKAIWYLEDELKLRKGRLKNG